MNCKKFRKVAYIYLKKELPRDQMKEAGLHLSQCADCKDKIQQMESLLNKTNAYLRFAGEDHQISLPKPTLIKNINEKNPRFFKPIILIPAAAALLFTAVSIFIIMRNTGESEIIRKITTDSLHTANLEKNDPPMKKSDFNVIESNTYKRKRRSEKPGTSDEFGKSYSRWLNARRHTNDAVIVEVIYPDLDIKTIHFLKNK